MTLTRHRPLQRHKPLQGSAPLKRTRMRRTLPEQPTTRHPRPKGPDTQTVLRVIQRDSSRCVVCGKLCVGQRGLDWSIHHRRGRDGRPDCNAAQNLILVCGPDNVTGCHGRIHQRRSESRPNGWWLSRVANEDPLTVPLLLHGERSVYLTEDFRYADNPPLQAVA